MSKCTDDTIIAQATPPGRGGIGVLRISGSKVIEVANIVLGKLPQPRYADYLPFYDANGRILDHGIAIYFPAPNSFTGEDILELQGHGGPVILDLLLNRILAINKIRIANPGEFSERAFLNDKIDLTQAEAIADLINSSTERAARSAMNSLRGVFSRQIHKIVEMLTNLRVYIETAINFPNENIDLPFDNEIKIKLNEIITSLDKIRSQAHKGSLLRDGIKVVIAGRPNAGKSSLLNVLSDREVAIVTDVAGTTRDALCEHIHIDGIPLRIIDTAGLHETSDKIESIGIERAWQEITQADHILFMVDSTTTQATKLEQIWPEFITARLQKTLPVTVIRNKVDITNEPIMITKVGNYSLIHISVKRKEGINLLRQHLKESIGFNQHIAGGEFLARRRHLQALNITANHLQQGYQLMTSSISGGELLAEELYLAQQALSEITGEFSSDNLLGRIFSSFCIGK